MERSYFHGSKKKQQELVKFWHISDRSVWCHRWFHAHACSAQNEISRLWRNLQIWPNCNLQNKWWASVTQSSVPIYSAKTNFQTQYNRITQYKKCWVRFLSKEIQCRPFHVCGSVSSSSCRYMSSSCQRNRAEASLFAREIGKLNVISYREI